MRIFSRAPGARATPSVAAVAARLRLSQISGRYQYLLRGWRGASNRLLVCPPEDFQSSAGIFDKGGAAFNPVSIVEIEDTVDRADRGVMNVSANDAVEAAALHV